MKKLIACVVIICGVVAAKAATYNWNIRSEASVAFTNQDGSSYTGSYNLWFYEADAATSTAINYADYTYYTSQLTMTSGAIDSATVSALSPDDRYASRGDDPVMDPEKTYKFFLTYDDAVTGETFTSASTSAYTPNSMAAGITVSFNSNAGTWSGDAAPEPTSGLLLLCGLAGLALRRKKA